MRSLHLCQAEYEDWLPQKVFIARISEVVSPHKGQGGLPGGGVGADDK